MQILYGYLLLCSPVRYRKAFKVALRSSLIFSCKGREAILSCDQHTEHLQKGHMMFTNRLLEKCKRELTVDLLRRNASASSTKSSSLVQCERISFIFLFFYLWICSFFFYLLNYKYNTQRHVTYPRRLVFAQSNTLCMAVTPSRPMGATSPPVMIA